MKPLRKWLLLFFLLLALPANSQPRLRFIEYEDFNHQVTHVSRMVRDGQGLMWFSTNDGLFRFDGYEFKNFKSRPGDGVNMTSNRISSMYSSSEGNIWFVSGGRVFLFDTRSYRYVDLLSEFEKQQGRTFHISKLRPLPNKVTWLFSDEGQVMVCDAEPTRRTGRTTAESIRIVAEHEDVSNITAICDGQLRSWVLTGTHTYLYYKGQLKRFDQHFLRLISSKQRVWMVSDDGKLWAYDEKAEQLRPLPHPLLTTAVNGHYNLKSGKIALCIEGGMLLMSPDGSKITKTVVNRPVRKLVQDDAGRVWILGKDGRLGMSDADMQGHTLIGGITMKDFNLYDVSDGTLWFFAEAGGTFYAYPNQPTQLHAYPGEEQIGKISNSIDDGQGGYWLLRKGHICRMTFESQHFKPLPLHAEDQVRCLVTDRNGRIFAGTRNDEAITVFSPAAQRLGWLKRDGHISPTYQSFGAAIYSALQQTDGTLWLGSKRDGVFRLRTKQDGSYEIRQFAKDDANAKAISDNEVYDFATDSRGRLWVGTHRGGLCCVENPQAETPAFEHAHGGSLKGWTARREAGISSLLALADGLLLVGTYDGLYVGDVTSADLASITFKHHQREANRHNSLSSCAITDIIRTSDRRIFLATEDGGINEIITKDLGADQLEFRHYNLSTGFPTDITHKLSEADGSLWIPVTNRLIELPLHTPSQPDANTYFMYQQPNFSAASPIHAGDSQWIFGTDSGAIMIDLKQLKGHTFTPPLIITGVAKEGGPTDYAAGHCDTITLSARERSLTIWFSALDYDDPRRIGYAYRMDSDDQKAWTYLGQNHSIALSQMQPGTYQLTIRSTNSNGIWCSNERTLTVIVKPTFWQTPWALLLAVLLVAAITAAILYTVLYIGRLKRQQRETLEKYLALLPQADAPAQPLPTEPASPATTDRQPAEERDDVLMKRLVSFIEANIANSDISIDDVAQACAVSRTSLHRKVKSMTGTSPMEFVREARIRKATQLLAYTSKTISEIAYECGFADPKYFSKCFKAATGKTPTEFRG